MIGATPSYGVDEIDAEEAYTYDVYTEGRVVQKSPNFANFQYIHFKQKYPKMVRTSYVNRPCG